MNIKPHPRGGYLVRIHGRTVHTNERTLRSVHAMANLFPDAHLPGLAELDALAWQSYVERQLQGIAGVGVTDGRATIH